MSLSVRHHWQPTISQLFSFYQGILMSYTDPVIQYHQVPTTICTIVNQYTASSSRNTQLSQLDLFSLTLIWNKSPTKVKHTAAWYSNQQEVTFPSWKVRHDECARVDIDKLGKLKLNQFETFLFSLRGSSSPPELISMQRLLQTTKHSKLYLAIQPGSLKIGTFHLNVSDLLKWFVDGCKSCCKI